VSDGFDWDEANISHIALHDVTPEEAEQVVANNPVEILEQFVGDERRFLQVGVTNELRCLGLVTTWRGVRLRVVTAYAAPRYLRRIYETERRGG
jgi:uncharacterized DUF497 family protein